MGPVRSYGIRSMWEEEEEEEEGEDEGYGVVLERVHPSESVSPCSPFV